MLNNIPNLRELITTSILIKVFLNSYSFHQFLMFGLQPSLELMIMVIHCLMCEVLQVDVEVLN
jgi:hypothetical protein